MNTENNVEQTNLEPVESSAQQMNPQSETPVSEKQEDKSEDKDNQKQDNQTLDAIIEQYSSKTREELTEELANLLNTENFEELRIRIPLLRNAFNALPKPVTETKTAETEQSAEGEEKQPEQQVPAVDPTEEKFYALYNQYKQKRQQYLEEQEKQKEKNLEKKKSLLEQLRTLLDSEKTLKEIYDDFNKIQEEWKNIGNVPHTEVNNLWESYHFLIDKFYEKVKINRELRDLDLKKNLDDKLALCEKAEELLLIEDINMSFQILQEYHRQWKQIGAVPSDKNEEVWERFKNASESINARRREYYDKRANELEENLKQKQALLDKAIEINSRQRDKISQWNDDANQMNEIVEAWKKIGPVPRQYNEEIWGKFKAQKDGFFDARKEMFAHSKQVEEENYNKKLSICERAEEIVKRTDFDQATKDLLALQEEWKQVGFVRKALSDKLWLRFRSSCDEFFKLKSEEFMRTHQEAEENIKKKEELIKELSEQTFTEDKVQNLNILKDFQKRWFEVGFTPKQERQKLQQKWDEIISSNKEKLQITAEEIAQRGSKFLNNVAQMAQGGKKMITNRIANLEKQIDSLENNIGFLSGSKNADILKKEFENKIARLKEEKNNLLKHLKDSEDKKDKISEESNNSENEALESKNNSENTEKE